MNLPRIPLVAPVLLAILLGAPASPASTPEPSADQPAPSTWPEMTLRELDAVHATLAAAHPGAIDEQNPAFRDWLERGWREARALAPRVTRYNDFLSAVRWYTSGFEDGHLGYSDDIRDNTRDAHRIGIRGWHVDVDASGRYVVDAVAPAWPVALPPLGAYWESCDGTPAAALLATMVAPYQDRRPLATSRRGVARAFFAPKLADQPCGDVHLPRS